MNSLYIYFYDNHYIRIEANELLPHLGNNIKSLIDRLIEGPLTTIQTTEKTYYVFTDKINYLEVF